MWVNVSRVCIFYGIKGDIIYDRYCGLCVIYQVLIKIFLSGVVNAICVLLLDWYVIRDCCVLKKKCSQCRRKEINL